jgi:dienelactone hydrolase
MICHGAADPFVKPGAIESYMATMEKSGLDWHLLIYGGAKPSLTNPGADSKTIPALGYSRSADQRSWEDMKVFVAEIF